MGPRKEKRPIWKICIAGSDDPVDWVDHPPNPRFALFDPLGGSSAADGAALGDDLVLDKETGLVWARDAGLIGQHDWETCNSHCRVLELGGRAGWRLPRVEELSSLVDPLEAELALPAGHPFVNVQYGAGIPPYWTSTNRENPTPGPAAWSVNFWRGAGPGLAVISNKTLPGFAWPVRGGAGGVSWSW